jgi:hypothetical protein
MQPSPRRSRRSKIKTLSIAAGSAALALALALLGGCARPVVLDDTLLEQMAENACVSRCQATKNACDDEARWDFSRCEADYQSAWRTYRYCQASSAEGCGYPWWSCAENLYGYCSNRYWECREACRQTYR